LRSNGSSFIACWTLPVRSWSNVRRARRIPLSFSHLPRRCIPFYNGFENIFKRIAVELDGGLPDNEFWHRELLDSMAGRVTTGLPSSPDK
jgi:hypothetical protein